MAQTKSTLLPLYSFFLQVIALWGLMSILIWQILKPNCPIYNVVDVYISHLDGKNSTFRHAWNSTAKQSWKPNFHGASSNSTNQNISIILEIEISNPNKRIGIYYDDIKVALYNHSGSFIGNNSVAGFQQGYRKTSFCEVKVEANYHHFWTGITDRSVDLRVRLKTGVQYVYGIFGYRTKPHQMDIDAYLSIVSEGIKVVIKRGDTTCSEHNRM